MFKTFAIAAMLALPGAAQAQTTPVEPLEWELDTEALREGLLAIGKADPAAQDPEIKAQLLALRERLGNLKAALGDGPEADAMLKVLQNLGMDGAEGFSTVLSQEALDIARAFGGTVGNGDAAQAEEHVRRLLAGEELKPDK